jgi:hypothetical protein
MTDALSLPDNKLVGIDGRPLDSDQPFWLNTEQEAKDDVAKNMGDIDDIEVFFGWVLVAKHVRNMVGVGLHAAPETQNEDRWQGKVGLIIKKGPAAFKDDKNNQFYNANPKVGDWVIYRSSDGWDLNIGSRINRGAYLECRLIQDAHIVGTTTYPGRVY